MIHLAGIGGVGMSALAQALLDLGHPVSGSDRLLDRGDLTETLARLKRQGVPLFPQDGSGITPGTERLIVSSAIEESNPDLLKARSFGIPVVHRAAELSNAFRGRKLIAVAGTCGKSTVTALLGHLLIGAGFDPLVVNGAEIPGWDRNGSRVGSVHCGRGEWAVAEVDESDRSLMAFHPHAAIITNASADHFSLDEALSLFAAFRKQVPGPVIDGREGVGEPEGIRLGAWEGSFVVDGLRYTLPMPGHHNVLNAWYAVRMALSIGADPRKLVEALASFPGVARRLQRVGNCGRALVIDDYAHNPEKLSAAWQTLAADFPQGICALWRPHGYSPLRKMGEALAGLFPRICRPQDQLILLPVYDAGGTTDRSVNTDILANRLVEAGLNVLYLPDMEHAERSMREAAGRVGVLVTFGARDPDLPRLAARLAGTASSH